MIINKIKKFFPLNVIKKSNFFNEEWYSAEYQIEKNISAKHYLDKGWKLGYDPSKDFNSTDYLINNPDIKGINPLLHYELYGKYEGRRAFKHIDITKTSTIEIDKIDTNRLSEIIKNKEIVSFDVFDTLLIRPFVDAKDIYMYIEQKYQLNGFYNARIEAENKARQSLNKEVTIYEIYEYIDNKYSNIIDLEVKTELLLIEANPLLLNIYQEAKKQNKKIIVISDMYLDSKTLELMLQKNNINIDKIYVSCEFNKRKADGELYKYVISDLNTSPSNIVHIGDNYISDYVMANDNGILGYKVPTIINNNLSNNETNFCLSYYNSNKNIEISKLIHLFSQYYCCNDNTNFYEKLGYMLAGPLVLGYLRYVCESAKNNNIDLLLFVSRDGYLLKEIYLKYFYQKYNIDYNYAYLSRACIISSDTNKNDYDINTLIRILSLQSNKITYHDSIENNQKEYFDKKSVIADIINNNFNNMTKHLYSITDNCSNIAVIDMATGKFSSYSYAKRILKDRNIFGYYAASFKDVNDNNIKVYSDRILGMRDNLAIKISELLVTSYENPIIGVDEYGNAIYENGDNSIQSNRYNHIIAGVEKFISDYLKKYGSYDEYVFTFDNWIKYVNQYILECPDNDIEYFSRIIDSEAPISKIKDKKISDLIDLYRKNKY